ncbi:hypothetical protein JTB14_032436 [Gonioctena quinquepunctata]|nr:hypothetical protein JTB14_032436 [Gonioctena quinquepunctata]
MIIFEKIVLLCLCSVLDGYFVKGGDLKEIENLVKQWSPLIWMAPNEKYMPMNAEEFLRYVYVADEGGKKLQNYLDGRISKALLQISQPSYLMTYRSLDDLSNDTDSFIYGKNPNFYPIPIYALVTDCKYDLCQNRFENEVSSDMNGTHSRSNASFYFHVSYWAFFPYNQGKDMCFLGIVPTVRIFNTCLGRMKTMGNHVGDWEHMSLSFAGKKVPDKMYLSVHDVGTYYTYNEAGKYFKLDEQRNRKVHLKVPKYPNIVRTQGEHPVLFAAQGSHGLWSSPGEHDYIRVPKLTDKNGFGIPWKTWNNIQIYHLGKSVIPHWMSYSGKWGNPKKNCLLEKLGLCEYSDGPQGILREKQDFYCVSC